MRGLWILASVCSISEQWWRVVRETWWVKKCSFFVRICTLYIHILWISQFPFLSFACFKFLSIFSKIRKKWTYGVHSINKQKHNMSSKFQTVLMYEPLNLWIFHFFLFILITPITDINLILFTPYSELICVK